MQREPQALPTTATAARLQALRTLLRQTDCAALTSEELFERCEAEVAGCTVDEIVLALRHVAAEEVAEADALEREGGHRRARP